MWNPSELFAFPADRVSRNESGFTVDWQVPEDSPYFEGHFPGNPVFPAIGIIDASCEGIRKITGQEFPLSGVRSAKFKSALGPNMRVKIHFSSIEEKRWRAAWMAPDGAIVADLTIEF